VIHLGRISMNEINSTIESRFDELKQLISNSTNNDPNVLSIDGLLDAFIVIYDECSNAKLRGEKTIKEFLEYGSFFKDIFDFI